ncbi:MAG: hypothetical protein JSU63_04485 [Phycisphaerales bacterium]|nr:MAG: hypothetical protein JSU63_04485 [Phycisphaerales bacterium]
MFSMQRSTGTYVLSVSLIMLTAAAQTARADGATRDLSAYSAPGVAFTVVIAIDTPPATGMAGLDEAPPTGWSVSNISDGGTWDSQTEEVKWLFFDPSIPPQVTYDVMPPIDASGEHCFTGTITFDSLPLPVAIDGDDCILFDAPAVSEWGVIVMAIIGLVAGTGVLAAREHYAN